jgi:CDP-diacylglycerol--glycerol-3-phosphate 3-phosphatidyltransferase
MERNLPNLITVARVVASPLVAVLLLQPNLAARLVAFLVFVAAALSDLWDGYLARTRGQVTDFGKIVDPMADKLLLICTLVPLYFVTTANLSLAGIPVFGAIPLWVVLVLLGRELLITLLRLAAARRGEVVSARTLGKRKAVAQNIFIGAAILWVAFRSPGFGEPGGGLWRLFTEVHGWFTAAFLMLALALTVASMVLYLFTFSRIFARGYS